MEEATNVKTKGPIRWWMIVVIGALVLALVGTGVLMAAYQHRVSLPDNVQAKLDLMPDLNAQSSTLPATGSAGADSFRVVINQTITMEDGASPCVIGAENPDENSYDLRVSLYLRDTGELLGATHRIRRGKRVDELKLNTVLPAGTYDAVAILELFDDQQTLSGQLSVDISLLVQQ